MRLTNPVTLPIVFVAFFVAGCSSTPKQSANTTAADSSRLPQGRVETKHSLNISSLPGKTYSLLPSVHNMNSPEEEKSACEQAMAPYLEKLGMTKANHFSNADYILQYSYSLNNRPTVEPTSISTFGERAKETNDPGYVDIAKFVPAKTILPEYGATGHKDFSPQSVIFGFTVWEYGEFNKKDKSKPAYSTYMYAPYSIFGNDMREAVNYFIGQVFSDFPGKNRALEVFNISYTKP